MTAGLTSRELDVMELVSQGNTSRQVGHALFIRPRTVEMHVNSSMQKLQCRTRAEAVRRLASSEHCPGRTWSGKSRANRATLPFAPARYGRVPVLC